MKAESINKKETPWRQGNLCRGVFCVEERERGKGKEKGKGGWQKRGEKERGKGKTGAKKPGPQARRRSKI